MNSLLNVKSIHKGENQSRTALRSAGDGMPRSTSQGPRQGKNLARPLPFCGANPGTSGFRGSPPGGGASAGLSNCEEAPPSPLRPGGLSGEGKDQGDPLDAVEG